LWKGRSPKFFFLFLWVKAGKTQRFQALVEVEIPIVSLFPPCEGLATSFILKEVTLAFLPNKSSPSLLILTPVLAETSHSPFSTRRRMASFFLEVSTFDSVADMGTDRDGKGKAII